MTTHEFSDCLSRHLLARNPFTDNRVNAPTEEAVDVTAVHAAPFERLAGLTREALAARRGIGAMVWGEAGIGKSHLLGRLDRWARSECRACSVYLHNIQAEPAQLPRTLLRTVVDRLIWTENDSPGQTELFGMIHESVIRALGRREVSWSQLRQSLFTTLAKDGPADASLADQTAIDILFRFYRSVQRLARGKEDAGNTRAALRWLRGDAINSGRAAQLGLPPGRTEDTPVAIQDTQQIKQILSVLTRLAATCERPFLLLFDQVDNLEEDQAAAFFRFLESLIDSSRNLLVVTAGIQHMLLDWRQRKVIQESAWDRLAQITIQLQKVNSSQARQVLEKRLQQFFADHEDPALQRLLFEDPLFPLGKEWFEREVAERVEMRPREAITLAEEAWNREQQRLSQQGTGHWQEGWKELQGPEDEVAVPVPVETGDHHELIDRAVQSAISQHATARRGTAPDNDSLAEAIADLLDAHRRHSPADSLTGVERRESATATPYDLLLSHRTGGGGEAVTGLVLATGANAYQMAPLLTRLLNDPAPPNRLLIIRKDTAPALDAKAEEYLEQLKRRPGCAVEIITVQSEELITLDALHAVWNLARDEDLSVTPSTGSRSLVSGDQVIASHERKGRFTGSKLLSAALAVPTSVEVFPVLDLSLDSPESAFVEETPMLASPDAVEELVEEALFAEPVMHEVEEAEEIDEIEEIEEIEEAVLEEDVEEHALLTEAVMDEEDIEEALLAEPVVADEVISEAVAEESTEEMLFSDGSSDSDKT